MYAHAIVLVQLIILYNVFTWVIFTLVFYVNINTGFIQCSKPSKICFSRCLYF